MYLLGRMHYTLKVLSLQFLKDMFLIGSTDFGNVSFLVPGIHPFFYIGTKALNHTAQYTEAAGKSEPQSRISLYTGLTRLIV